jgi:hypothetical protein
MALVVDELGPRDVSTLRLVNRAAEDFVTDYRPDSMAGKFAHAFLAGRAMGAAELARGFEFVAGSRELVLRNVRLDDDAIARCNRILGSAPKLRRLSFERAVTSGYQLTALRFDLVPELTHLRFLTCPFDASLMRTSPLMALRDLVDLRLENVSQYSNSASLPFDAFPFLRWLSLTNVTLGPTRKLRLPASLRVLDLSNTTTKPGGRLADQLPLATSTPALRSLRLDGVTLADPTDAISLPASLRDLHVEHLDARDVRRAYPSLVPDDLRTLTPNLEFLLYYSSRPPPDPAARFRFPTGLRLAEFAWNAAVVDQLRPSLPPGASLSRFLPHGRHVGALLPPFFEHR